VKLSGAGYFFFFVKVMAVTSILFVVVWPGFTKAKPTCRMKGSRRRLEGFDDPTSGLGENENFDKRSDPNSLTTSSCAPVAAFNQAAREAGNTATAARVITAAITAAR